MLGGMRDVALIIIIPSYTDSIKPSLQCSCNFVVINASEGSLCFQSFVMQVFFLYSNYYLNIDHIMNGLDESGVSYMYIGTFKLIKVIHRLLRKEVKTSPIAYNN
jgi:hypothetical protein